MKFFYLKGARNMTEDSYKILYAGGEHEIVVKKSRFIATTKPVAPMPRLIRQETGATKAVAINALFRAAAASLI